MTFVQLAAAGHGWGAFAYADALNSGEATRKNEKKAFELYKKCAEVGIPPAYMNVCNMYTYGTGTEKVSDTTIAAGMCKLFLTTLFFVSSPERDGGFEVVD